MRNFLVWFFWGVGFMALTSVVLKPVIEKGIAMCTTYEQVLFMILLLVFGILIGFLLAIRFK
jgi:hypothetical protein